MAVCAGDHRSDDAHVDHTAGIRRPPFLPAGRLWYSGEVILNDLQQELREFAARRDWQRFHTPKNLVMAFCGEVGELTELFQWLTPEESSTVMERADQAERVREEVADVFAYLLQIADTLDIDLAAALRAKMRSNELKYPSHIAGIRRHAPPSYSARRRSACISYTEPGRDAAVAGVLRVSTDVTSHHLEFARPAHFCRPFAPCPVSERTTIVPRWT